MYRGERHRHGPLTLKRKLLWEVGMQRRAETDTVLHVRSGAARMAFTLNNEKTPLREATTTGENQKYCFTIGGKM